MIESQFLENEFISELKFHLSGLRAQLLPKLAEINSITLPIGANTLIFTYHCSYFDLYALPISMGASTQDLTEYFPLDVDVENAWIIGSSPPVESLAWRDNSDYDVFYLAVKIAGDFIYDVCHQIGLDAYRGNILFVVLEGQYPELDLKTGVWSYDL